MDFDQLQTAVIRLNAEDALVFANAAAEELLGVGPAWREQLAATLLQDTPGALLRRARDSGSALSVREVDWPVDGRSLLLDLDLTPLADGDLLIELRDASPRARALADHERGVRQALSRRVARQMAHEIRNPLAGLKGAAQLLTRGEQDPRRLEFLEIIRTEIERLEALVGGMLGPDQQPRRARQNIHRPLDRLHGLLTAESGGAVELARDYDPSIPEFEFDAERLSQALLNLGRNALQAGARRVRLVTRIARNQTWSGVRHKAAVAIEIHDDGAGVPEALAESLFFPLVTGRPDGHGLGLAIAQELIDAEGGRIEFNSRPGETVFRILLPLEPEDS